MTERIRFALCVVDENEKPISTRVLFDGDYDNEIIKILKEKHNIDGYKEVAAMIHEVIEHSLCDELIYAMVKESK